MKTYSNQIKKVLCSVDRVSARGPALASAVSRECVRAAERGILYGKIQVKSSQVDGNTQSYKSFFTVVLQFCFQLSTYIRYTVCECRVEDRGSVPATLGRRPLWGPNHLTESVRQTRRVGVCVLFWFGVVPCVCACVGPSRFVGALQTLVVFRVSVTLPLEKKIIK
jgi:hypothetical protein